MINYVSPELTFLMTNSSRCLRTKKKTRRTIAENLHHLLYRMEFTETDALTEALAFKKLPMYKEAFPGSMAHIKRYVNDLLPDKTVLRVCPRDTLMVKPSIMYIYGPWVPDASWTWWILVGMRCDWKPVPHVRHPMWQIFTISLSLMIGTVWPTLTCETKVLKLPSILAAW